MDYELFGNGVVSRGSLHFHGVVTETQLCKAETTHVSQVIHFLKEGFMSFRVESYQSASEQVVLHSELGSQRSVYICQHFMRGE